MASLVPGYGEMSPRTRYEEVAIKLLGLLEEKKL